MTLVLATDVFGKGVLINMDSVQCVCVEYTSDHKEEYTSVEFLEGRQGWLKIKETPKQLYDMIIKEDIGC